MYAKINSMTVKGIDGVQIFIEVDVVSGLPDFALVGDLSSEVKEARERVKTSIRNSGFEIPPKRVTINLAPADIRKEGTAFDLPIAIGILCAYGELKSDTFKDYVILGELGLDGRVLPVPGTLPMVLAAKKSGYTGCIVPLENASEGAVVDGLKVIGVGTLSETIEVLKNPSQALGTPIPGNINYQPVYDVDFSEVNGQLGMRRAAEVAAAGMHNILFIGSPGSGKTMISKRLSTILPDLTWEESLEVTRIYSVSGLTDVFHPIIRTRPYRSPHHTISPISLIGGGKYPKPGEVSLADRGILFLDELPEFQKNSLESLRQPLEDRIVSITRVTGSCIFPSNFMLCAAMNPCRCGYYPDRSRCNCSESEVKKYMQRISRPLLDRIDISVEAPPVAYRDLSPTESNESSSDIRRRVAECWSIQHDRFKDSNILFNSQMKGKDIKKYCQLSCEDENLMEAAFSKLNLSARGYHRVLRVARTIADLAKENNIKTDHLLEALSYRGIADRIWG